jgi:hypothetical protein
LKGGARRLPEGFKKIFQGGKKVKSKRKILSILVTMSMLLVLLVPLAGIASAGTTYQTITTVPSFDPAAVTADSVKGATVEVAIDPYDITITSTALLEVVDANGRSLPIISVGGTDVFGEKIFKYTFDGTQDSDNSRLYYQDLVIYFDGSNANAGAVSAKFSKAGGQLLAGTVTIANAKGGAVEVSVPSVSAISDAGVEPNDVNAIEIRLNETVNGGFAVGPGSVKLKLPTGFTWNGWDLTVLNRTITGEFTALTLDDGRTLAIEAPGGYPTGTVLLQLLAGLTVDSTTAKYGDIKVKVSGESTVTPTEIVVGTYGDYTATVSKVTTTTVMSGQVEQDAGKFSIDEALPGTLVEDRTIILTLPEQAKWSGDLYALSVGDSDNIGNFETNGFEIVGTDNRTIKTTVTHPSTGQEPTKIVFKNGQISVRGDYTGDIILTVEGSAGAKGTVKIADAKAPVTATADTKPEVIIGLGSQAGGDITITETELEALQAKYDEVDEHTMLAYATADAYLRIEAPPGVRFASVPTFAVTGDVLLGDPICDTDYEFIEVRVKSTSSAPASVKISDIKLIVDRTVPEGDIMLKVGGSSLVENNIDGLFPNVNWVTKVADAKVITPAPSDTKVTSVFTINSTKYTANGIEKTMDVAPFIKDSRTYMPIRYVAEACGVADSNILWNQATQTVTLIRGSVVIQVTVGSTVMMLNGTPIGMDVAPVNIAPGRVMLPISWVAQALGNTVQWDAVAQTVTIN